MLQGTLDVFSLDEVLGLLSGANKNGVLNITGDRGVGSVSILDGHLVAGSASSAPGAATLSDVVFELLRYEEGSFSFDGSAEAEGEPHELEAIMSEAHGRLDEWKGIEAVVPSLDHHVSLAATLSTSQVTLSESEWAAVVAIGEGATAGVIANRLGLGEFDGSKRIKSLIERSLASLEDSASAPTADTVVVATPAVEVEAAAPVVEAAEAPAFTAPVFETPAPAPASFADVAASEPIEALDTVAPDAPAFQDATPAFEAPVFEEAVPGFESAEASSADTEIPPMPEAPAFASFESADDTEVPPMPEPPAANAFASDGFDVPPAPAADATPPTFGGLDPIDGPDIFEAPRRAEDHAADVFGTTSADAGFSSAEMEAPMPPPPASAGSVSDVPSFAPPAGFDAEAFGGVEDLTAPADDDVAEAAEEAAPEKGGSLLMRYLKSNG